MNLADREILELNELCNAVVEGTTTLAQNERLSHWLSTSEEARQFYVRALGLSASLYSYASEMQAEGATAPAPQPKTIAAAFRWWLGSLSTAAAIVLVFWIINRPTPLVPLVEAKADESVAQLTGSKECRWVGTGASIRPGDQLRKGERLELVSGLAEITFDSGAQVVLEGPASLELNSAWEATLLQGALKANVPPEAIGFLISNPVVEVRDLGTEFTMIADASGATDVLVLKGKVEAEPQSAVDRQTIQLLENESRRFANTGVSKVSDSEQKFARYTRAFPLDRFAPATGYVHWSFDEAGGNLLRADARGNPLDAFNAQLQADPQTEVTAARTEGRRQRALQFDGHSFAKAAFPGISGCSPHTVVFWVKVPEDAPLSDAYAIVAWNTSCKKLNQHPVHINWNRNPVEGTVGVLRTDYGGGFALGATPLRDGRWHHVAVVFAPGQDDKSPVEVKQYVDGRLEGEGNPSPSGARKSPVVDDAGDTATQTNVVWFGRRLGHERQRRDRFRGEIDELFIADCALGPREIVQLMKDNQPPAQLAATAK